MTVEAAPAADGGLSPAEAATVAALVDRYAAAREAQSSAAVAALLWLWRQFLVLGPGGKVSNAAEARAVAAVRTVPAADFARALSRSQLDVLYDEDAVTELATQLASQSADAQRQAADLAGEFERQVLQFFDAPTRARVEGPTKESSSIATSRSDVDPAEVYARPAVRYRYERSTDASVEEALADAEDRLQRIAEDDLTVAERDAFWDIVNGPDESRVTGYRRVLRPELSKFGACGLCIAAADRVYSREDLMPIHHRCKCIVLPVMDGKDPGLNLNEDDLKTLYAAAGGTTSGRTKNGKAGLERIRVQTVEHGELGPVLVRYGKGFLTQEEADSRRRDRDERRAAREAAAAAKKARRTTNT